MAGGGESRYAPGRYARQRLRPRGCGGVSRSANGGPTPAVETARTLSMHHERRVHRAPLGDDSDNLSLALSERQQRRGCTIRLSGGQLNSVEERGGSMETKEQRWLGIGGLVFVVLAVVLIAVTPSAPAVHASSAKLASHYSKSKQGQFFAGGFVTLAAVVLGVFWFWYFRELLAGVAAARRLATVGFAGAVIFAAGGGLAAGLDFVIS